MSESILECSDYPEKVLSCLASGINKEIRIQITATVQGVSVPVSYEVTLEKPKIEDGFWGVFVKTTENGNTQKNGYYLDSEKKAKDFIDNIFKGILESQLNGIKMC